MLFLLMELNAGFRLKGGNQKMEVNGDLTMSMTKLLVTLQIMKEISLSPLCMAAGIWLLNGKDQNPII